MKKHIIAALGLLAIGFWCLQQAPQLRADLFVPPVILSSGNNIAWNSRMEVAQSATKYTAGVDGWFNYQAGTMVATRAQVASSIAGFTSAMKYTITTAQASLGVNDHYSPYLSIEGYRINPLQWGTVNAKPLTVAFKVRTNFTGSSSFGVQNASSNRLYNVPYSFTANTDTVVVAVIPGETTGTWQAGSGIGMYLLWGLAGGTNILGAANSWITTNTYVVSTSTNFAGTLGNTFEVSGLVMVVGSVPLSDALLQSLCRPFNEELETAQRYYETSYTAAVGVTWTQGAGNAFEGGGAAADQNAFIPFKVKKRIAPTMTTYDRTGTAARYTSGVGGAYTDNRTFAAGPTATINGFYVRNTIAASTVFGVAWEADATMP